MKYTDELDKVSYSLGLSIASNLISSGVTTINAEAFIDGLNVVFSGKMPEIMPDEANIISYRIISTNSSKQKEKRQKLKAKSSWQKTRKKKA